MKKFLLIIAALTALLSSSQVLEFDPNFELQDLDDDDSNEPDTSTGAITESN